MFDTPRVTGILRDAGIGEAPAEAITESVRVALAGGVAAKAHLVATRVDLAAKEARICRHLRMMVAGIVNCHGRVGETPPPSLRPDSSPWFFASIHGPDSSRGFFVRILRTDPPGCLPA